MVLDGNYPRMPAMRQRLGDIDEILIGRGRQREVTVEDAGGIRRLILRFPDPWMSSAHVRIECHSESRAMTDPGSKNGSFVNGSRQNRAVLVDGDLLQFGHTFFIYRDALPPHPDDLAPELMHKPMFGLATLLGPLAQVLGELEQVASTTQPILLSGDPGTGKNTVARALHTLSGRRGAFVDVQCAALVEPLIERQLFGYGHGSHAGADVAQPGLIESAHGGTLFLDEIAALRPTAQEILLRVMRERTIVPVGSSTPMAVDLRIIATVTGNVDEPIATAGLAPEFLRALQAHRTVLPPLRRRREDFAIFLAEVLARHAPNDAVCFSAEAAHALLTYPWPRNLRELDACLRTALGMREAAVIEIHHLAADLQGVPDHDMDAGGDTVDTIELSEQDLRQRTELIAMLRAKSGDVSATAHALGKARHQIQRWLERFDIDTTRFRS